MLMDPKAWTIDSKDWNAGWELSSAAAINLQKSQLNNLIILF